MEAHNKKKKQKKSDHTEKDSKSKQLDARESLATLVGMFVLAVAIIAGGALYITSPTRSNLQVTEHTLSRRDELAFGEQDWRKEYIEYDFVNGSVPRIELDPFNITFAELIATQDTPVILYNTIVEKWRARSLWTPEYIIKNAPSLYGIQRHADKTFSYFHETRPMSALEDIVAPYRQATYDKVNMSAADFFETFKHVPPYFYYAATADTLGRAYHDLYPIEPLMVKPENFTNEESYLHRWTNVWLGPAGATTHNHYDIFHNFYAQIYGVKRFVLFPPEEANNLYLFPFLHPGGQQSQVKFPYNEERQKAFPKFKNAKAVDVILYPGDVLYLPPLWFHHVTALTTSMSVSVWTKSEETQLMHESVRTHLPFRRSWSKEKIILAGRLYIEMLITKIYGRESAVPFIQQLIEQRYHNLFDSHPILYSRDVSFCKNDLTAKLESENYADEMIKEFKIPLEEQYRRFMSIKNRARRDVWLGNLCEQLALTVVGLENVGKFLVDFTRC